MEKPRGFFHVLRTGAAGFILSPLPFLLGKDRRELMMDCFALCENGYCNALSGKCRGENCGFHKTREEQAQSLEKVSERLRSLPGYQQEAIADKYYGGVKKW